MVIQATGSIDVRSAAFEPHGEIPRKYSCDGAGVSPALEWSAGPSGTKSYALIMDDPDAPHGTFVHWVAWNIPKNSLREAIPPVERLPDGGMQGMNSAHEIGYVPPCPPSGTHRYYIKVYALDRELDLPMETTKEQLVAAMNDHILAQGELMGRYSHHAQRR